MSNKYMWLIGTAALENLLQDRVASSIKSNSEFHYQAGMTPKIVRTSSGHCCDWCDEVAGTYEYPNVPKDVYRRHKRCDCTVEYEPGNGKRQNVHSKAWSSDERQSRIDSINSLGTAPDNYINERTTDVTSEYVKRGASRSGSVILEDGYHEKNHEQEIQDSKWIKNLFGGNIKVLKEQTGDGVQTADYLWDSKLWELKSVSSKTSIDNQIRKACRQIEENPGGIIIDISNKKMSNDEMIAEIAYRLGKRANADIDVIIKDKNELVKIIRHKKE